MAKLRSFYAMAIEDAGNSERTGVITIDGNITNMPWYWFLPGETETSSQKFRADFEALALTPEEKLRIDINSMGGNLQAAIAICNMLKSLPNFTTARITSAAASAATIIAMGCQRIEMFSGTGMLIHCCASMDPNYEPMTADEHRIAADDCDRWDMAMAGFYAAKCGKSVDEVLAQMKKDAWMSAQEALAFGLCDEIIGTTVIASADAHNRQIVALGGHLLDFRGLPEPTFLAEEAATADAGEEAGGMTIAVDVDGVLAEYDAEAYDPMVIGEPRIGAQEFLQRLIDAGHTVIIHTCRAAEVVTAWLDANALPYNSVWTEAGKPLAQAYVDDRAVRFCGDYDEAFNAATGVDEELGVRSEELGDGEAGEELGVGDAALPAAVTAEYLAQHHPEVAAALHAQGVADERTRQAHLDALDAESVREIIAEARRAGTDLLTVTEQVNAAIKASGKGAAYLASRAADADAGGTQRIAADTAPVGTPTEASQIIAMAKQNVAMGLV